MQLQMPGSTYCQPTFYVVRIFAVYNERVCVCVRPTYTRAVLMTKHNKIPLIAYVVKPVTTKEGQENQYWWNKQCNYYFYCGWNATAKVHVKV